MTENKRFTVDENHQGVYAYIKDNNEYIGKRCGKKNVYYVCDLLNKQDQEIQKYRDGFYKAHEIQQDFIKQIQQIKSIMDNELKNAFNNRINHDDYNKDPELAEYFKGYHCGVSDLIKKIMEVLH